MATDPIDWDKFDSVIVNKQDLQMLEMSPETRKAIWWALQYRIAQIREDIKILENRGWPKQKATEELALLCDAQDLFVDEVAQ